VNLRQNELSCKRKRKRGRKMRMVGKRKRRRSGEGACVLRESDWRRYFCV